MSGLVAFNPSTEETGRGRRISEFKAILVYLVRPYLKKTKKRFSFLSHFIYYIII